MIRDQGQSNTFAIRTDASIDIGTGHVMRCLTLANSLAERGSDVRFLCRAHDGNLIELINRYGFSVEILSANEMRYPQKNDANDPPYAAWLGCDWQLDTQQCRSVLTDKVDWLIVDHYALDYRWELAMRKTCNHIMVIDDLADRKHDCDILLDQSLGREISDYHNFVNTNTHMLLGPKYALLRSEFAQWRSKSLARRQSPKLRHILVSMGGVDRDNVTGQVLTALDKCCHPTLEKITVIMGRNAPFLSAVSSAADNMKVPTTVLSGVENMAELLASSDLAIGAGGTTTWERCSLGVPSVLLVLADNQLNIARNLDRANAAFVIADLNTLEKSLISFLESTELVVHMAGYAQRSAEMLDASGVMKIISNLVGRGG